MLEQNSTFNNYFFERVTNTLLNGFLSSNCEQNLLLK